MMTLVSLAVIGLGTAWVVWAREHREQAAYCSESWRADYARREGRLR